MIQTLSVTEYLSLTNEILQPLSQIAVEGEVSGFTIRQNKWVFFTIKDENSAMECFSLTFKMPFHIEDGMQVRLIGYPSVYKKSGRFRFTVEQVIPVGQGALQKAYEALKIKLASEGLFDEHRKRPIPAQPENIGIICSIASAAYSDFIKIVKARWGAIELYVYDVRVQGDGAPVDICDALKWFNTQNQKVDVLVITRGGGSLEDLWGFNDERVARAIFASSIPIICGVGHEKDESLADFVADVRASTPTHGAQLVVPDRSEIIQTIKNDIDIMRYQCEQKIQKEQYKLAQSIHKIDHGIILLKQKTQHMVHVLIQNAENIVRKIELQKNKIMHKTKTWDATISTALHTTLSQITFMAQLLSAQNPQNLLKRGFSIVRDENQQLITSAKKCHKNQKINIQFKDGSKNAKLI